jgi:hypothetical protein
VRLFFSHSFSSRLVPRVRAFNALLEAAFREIADELRSKEAPGALRFEVIEGDKAEFGDPASALFPRIGRCDVFFSLLFDETASGPCKPYVSPSCLQELIVAYVARKPILAWVEKGCTSSLGFASSLTTYREFTVDDLLFDEAKAAIRDNIKQRLYEAFLPSQAQAATYLYCNTFDHGSPDDVQDFRWRRARRVKNERDEEEWKPEDQPRRGGQSLLPFGGESGGCLAIAATADTWNWSGWQGQSITTLGLLDPAPFAPGQEVVVEIRCRTNGNVRIRPLFNGPAVDPDDPGDRAKWNWPLVIDAQDSDWGWKSVSFEEGWVSLIFRARITYPEGYRVQDTVKFYLIAETSEDIVLIDRVLLGLGASP